MIKLESDHSTKDIQKTRKRPTYIKPTSYKGDIKNDRKRVSSFSSQNHK